MLTFHSITARPQKTERGSRHKTMAPENVDIPSHYEIGQYRSYYTPIHHIQNAGGIHYSGDTRHIKYEVINVGLGSFAWQTDPLRFTRRRTFRDSRLRCGRKRRHHYQSGIADIAGRQSFVAQHQRFSCPPDHTRGMADADGDGR